MDINRNNYELFFIDYIDGNLTADQRAAVESFLLFNPDLQREIENLSNHVLIPQSLEYEDKILIKRSDYSSVGLSNEFDYLCVSSVEGDINSDESSKLNHLINDNILMRSEYDQFHKTKLISNSKLVFPDKAKLKQFSIFGLNRMQIISFSSAAALILLLFGLFNFFSDELKTMNTSPLVDKIEMHPKKHFPELSYEVVPPKLEANVNESKGLILPIQDSENMDRDEEKSEAPFIQEDVKRTAIAYLEPRKLTSIAVLPKVYEIKLPPLQPEETLNYNVQIAQSSSSTNRVIGLYDLVEFGVNLIGKASGTDLKLEGMKDEDGELKRIQLESGLFALSVPVNRRK